MKNIIKVVVILLILSSNISVVNLQGMSEQMSPFSVELLSFEGVAKQKFNHIKWATASEQNSEYFVLLRSYDNNKFEKILVQKADGNSNICNNYDFDDITNESGSIYYKLEEHDLSGKIHSSKTIVLTRQKSDISFWQYDRKLLVNLKNCPYENINLCFYDDDGRLLSTSIFSQSEKNSLVIMDISNFPKGVYFANIYGNSDLLYSDKIVLNN